MKARSMRVLVINPNTSASVTDMVMASCRKAYPALHWDGATAAFGAAYVASEVAYAIAAHAMLDAFAENYTDHDAVLIACFGEPGLLALREICPVPVTGLAEASFLAAEKRGPFAVVTGGKAWEPMLTRFARTHQLDTQLLGVYTVELTGAQIAAAPDAAMESLRDACRQGMDAGAQSIVLGGAALVGMADGLQKQLAVPVLDNVLLGAEAVATATVQARARSGARPPSMSASPVRGLSAALSRLLS